MLAEKLIEKEGVDVVEGQEWEAPLYYLQLRRALGLGSRRTPPCLIHLHSPSELIFRYNQWDLTLADFLPLARFEAYSVRAADALVCPSRYLAKGAEGLFLLPRGSVEMIPYPLGDTPRLERSPEVWARNSICFVGRLELRKEIVEWVRAAVAVADRRSGVSFDFIGADTSLNGVAGPTLRAFLENLIPRGLRDRFRFHGSVRRPELLRRLAQTSVVVVPSLWETSHLPVLRR